MSGSKVLLVSHHAEIIGGGEISLMTLIEGLLDTRWQPSLAVPGPGVLADRCGALGVPVHLVPMPPVGRTGLGVLGATRSLRKVIADSNCSVLHANGSRAMVYAGLAARTMRRPALWHLRVLDPDPVSDAILVRLATGYIAISDAVRGRLKPWPAAHAQCRVIPNGLDLASFVPQRTPASSRAALGAGGGDFVVTTVGRLVDFKGHDILLEALALARRAIPNLKGVIVGDGPELPMLRSRAEQADLAGAIVFAGHREDIPDVLAASDAFVLPSPAEHFGRVLIEAMAVGVPVIACDAAGPAEIVDHDASGILVPAGDAAAMCAGVVRLCEDRRLGRQLAANARRRVEEHYSMQEHARRVSDFYETVAGKRA